MSLERIKIFSGNANPNLSSEIIHNLEILPAPTKPSILFVNSTPINLDFSHLPAWVEVEASGICLATANIIAIACSAVVIILPKGVFITITPFFEAAFKSMLSTPIPARPITFKFVAAPNNFSVTLVADLIAKLFYF